MIKGETLFSDLPMDPMLTLSEKTRDMEGSSLLACITQH
jgi:hypothetical protein